MNFFDERSELFLKAGFLTLGEFYGSFVLFYDLVNETVICVHTEEIEEDAHIEIWEDPSLIRPFVTHDAFCPDFNTFLRPACTEEVYDTDSCSFLK